MFAPDAGAAVMMELPELMVRPLTTWVLMRLLLPLICNVPPPRASAEVLLTMFVAGAPAALKSSLSVPALTVVVPV